MLAGDVSPHRVVAGEGARAVGAGGAYPLVALPDVRAQVCFVAVQALAVGALELLT